jgi:hypothetical protein
VGPPASRRISRARRYSGARARGPDRVSPTGLSPPLAGHPRPFGYAPDSCPLGAAAAAPRGSYNPPCATPAGLARTGFRLAPVRSPLLGGSRLMSLPPGTEMFQFPGLPPTPYGFRCRYPSMTSGGLPHSGTRGSKPAGDSPRTFVAFHALHRPSAPRHPPCARSSSPPRPRATPSRRDRLTTTTLQFSTCPPASRPATEGQSAPRRNPR